MTQILIVGAGPVGLTMAAELARYGMSGTAPASSLRARRKVMTGCSPMSAYPAKARRHPTRSRASCTGTAPWRCFRSREGVHA